MFQAPTDYITMGILNIDGNPDTINIDEITITHVVDPSIVENKFVVSCSGDLDDQSINNDLNDKININSLCCNGNTEQAIFLYQDYESQLSLDCTTQVSTTMSFNQLSTCSLVPTYHDDETVFKGNVTYSLCYQHPNECTNIITYMWPITITYSTRTSAGIGVEIGDKKSDREGEGVTTDYVLSSAMVCEDESCTSQRTNTHFKVSENIIIKHSSTDFELDFDRMILKRNENLEDWTHNTKVIAFEPLILETFAPAKCIGYTCEFDVESNVDHARNLRSSGVKYRNLRSSGVKYRKLQSSTELSIGNYKKQITRLLKQVLYLMLMMILIILISIQI